MIVIVNTKNLFQFIVYLLLGFFAIADPGMPRHVHDRAIIANDISCTVQSYTGCNTDPLVDAYADMHKKRSFIVRFRAEPSFRTDHPDTGRLVHAAVTSIITTAQAGKTTHIIPFYYVFLFRLTPF
jgi:hypothetical protein